MMTKQVGAGADKRVRFIRYMPLYLCGVLAAGGHWYARPPPPGM
jgi:hypothetical protein